MPNELEFAERNEKARERVIAASKVVYAQWKSKLSDNAPICITARTEYRDAMENLLLTENSNVEK